MNVSKRTVTNMSDVKKGMMSQRKPRRQPKAQTQTVKKGGEAGTTESKRWYKTPLGYVGIAAMIVAGIIVGGWVVSSLALGDTDTQEPLQNIRVIVRDNEYYDISTSTTVSVYSFTSEWSYNTWDEKIIDNASYSFLFTTTATLVNFTPAPVSGGLYTRYMATFSYAAPGYITYYEEITPGDNQINMFPLPSNVNLILSNASGIVSNFTDTGVLTVLYDTSFNNVTNFRSQIDFLHNRQLLLAINCTFSDPIEQGSMNVTSAPNMYTVAMNISTTSIIIASRVDVMGNGIFTVNVIIDPSVTLISASVIYGWSPPLKVYT